MSNAVAGGTSNGGFHGSVRVGPAVVGRVQAEPRLSLQALELSPTRVLTAARFEELVPWVVVPVEHETPRGHLRQTVVPGSRRVLASNAGSPSRTVVWPVVVSARANWTLRRGQVDVIDVGYVLDGACRLEACTDPSAMVPILIVLGLDEKQEVAVRQNLAPEIGPSENAPTRIDSSAPRMAVSTNPVTFEIESDPFVIPTALGYSPAVLVRRLDSQLREHLLIGAKSLALPLEHERRLRGTLEGLCVTIVKDGPQKTAVYVVVVNH